jgi:hypothetical protein
VFDFKIHGTLQSKVCIQRKALNGSEAAVECKRQGKRLYRMESDEAIESITRNAEPLFRGGQGGALWVDGMDPKTCQMINFNGKIFTPTTAACEITYWSFCEKVVIPKAKT